MSWFFLWLERRRSRSPPEGDQGNDDPLGQGREAGTYQRKLRHRVGICPASTDLGIEPLAEDRVGKAAENCERSYRVERSEEHTSELKSLMRNSYAVFCLTKKQQK